jgi:hypothetical protein
MTQGTKRTVKVLLTALVVGNVTFFLLLAYLGKLPTDPRSGIFIDFWGRLGVYSLWFVGFGLYSTYLREQAAARWIVMAALVVNVPLFLGLGYFGKLSPDPKDLPFIDFWGRITVYSVWFVAYEVYRKYLQDADSPMKGARA